MSEATSLLIAGILVLVNACFVAAEFSIVTVRRSRVEALVRGGSRRARVLERVVADLDTHLSAIQLAVTSVGIAMGWLAEPALAALIAAVLEPIGIMSSAVIHSIAFATAFLVITVCLIVAGELAPKFLSLRRTEQIALWMAPLVHGFARATRPLLNFMNRAARGLLGVFGADAPDPDYERMDAEELRIFLTDMSRFGRLSKAKRRLIENALEFAEHTARQIMVPRDQIDYLSLERSLDENLAVIMETGHTRYPLCETGLDTVAGMIHIKDLFQKRSIIHTSEDLRLIQHDMLFVPESQPIDVLQQMFQKTRCHMAIVVDEYGVPTGLVTLEDVLEELVGEIRDEFDADETPPIETTPDGVLVDGMLLLDDVRRELGIEIETNGADTLGGYVTNSLGRVPEVDDAFAIDGWEGRVVEMQGRRVARVLLRRREAEASAGSDTPAGGPTETRNGTPQIETGASSQARTEDGGVPDTKDGTGG